MTIQEAIREAEGVVEGGRTMHKELQLPGHDQYLDFMETLLAAAKKGAAEELQAEEDKEIEESKQLTLETVGRCIPYFEETIQEVQNGDLRLVSDGHRFGMVLEPALHTALAALRKVFADLTADPSNAEGNPRIRVVNMHVSGPQNMDKILGQVQGDLEKIFREAAEGKKEDKADEK